MDFDFLKFFIGSDGNAKAGTADAPLTIFNPTTGLPMLDNTTGGVDVGGSPFGMDIHSGMSDGFMESVGLNPWD